MAIFAVFLAYAYLSRATYRTTALVVVEPPLGSTARLPAPLEATRRLHEAVLRRELLQQLTAELAASGSDQDRIAAASRIRESLQVDTIDSREFAISYSDSDAARAQRFCNLLAKKAMEQAERALVPEQQAPPTESARDQRVAELVAFLAAHPDIGASEGAGGQAQNRNEDTIKLLQSEKRRLVAQLANAQSDNPYGDPAETKLSNEQIQRRLNEIDAVTQSLQQARNGATQPPQVKPAPAKAEDKPKLEGQLRELWKKVAEAPAAAPTPRAPLVARLAAPAPLPTAPVEPNRPLVLFIGLLVSMAFFGMVLVARASSHRRARHEPRPQPAPGTSRAPMPLKTVEGLGPVRAPQPAVMPAPEPIEAESKSNTREGDSSAPARTEAVPVAQVSVGPQFAQTQPVPAPSAGSLVPRAVVEVNAAPQARDVRRDAQQTEVLRAPVRRVTQVLGSIPEPIAPQREEARGSNGAEHRPMDMMRTQPLPAPGAAQVFQEPQRGGWAAEPDARPPLVVNTVGTSADGSDPPPPPPPFHERGGVQRANVADSWRPDPELLPDRRRELRDELLALRSPRAIVIGVASSREASEGKSRLASELGMALAQLGQKRVLLIESNFQHPNVHRLLGAMPSFATGFSQQLNQHARTPETGWTVLSCSRTLDVMAEGVLRSPGLMVSNQFDLCIAELREQYDYIVLDGPTFEMEPECRVLDAVVDALVLFRNADEDAKLAARASALFSPKVYQRVIAE